MTVHFFERQRDVLERRQMRKQIEGLKHRADCPAMAEQKILLEDDAFAVDPDRAGVGKSEAADDPEQRRFAAAGGADERERVNFVQRERYVRQHAMAVEAL